jgi:hypothetical protein
MLKKDLKRREELDIKAFALQESTARLEREKFEILKRRCESDEARVNVEKERLLQDRMKQKNDGERLKLDVERYKLEREERSGMFSLMTALVDKLKK